jgi:hypothetical protein
MMGIVNERALVGSAGRPHGPVSRDPTPGPATTRRRHGGPGPLVLSSEWHGGTRVSKVLRTDGSMFTVTVPSLGVYDHTEHLAPRQPWITDDSGRPELSTVAALRLAAAVAGPSGDRVLAVGG